ncbi:MAG: SMP-30/gluconolactonase/LRE family protein [Armatimonadaceae bacterium]
MYVGGLDGNDGIIARVTFGTDGSIENIEPFSDTEGHPIDLYFDPDGNLLVADWKRGLISIDPQGQITTLIAPETIVEGKSFRRPDGIAVGPDGTIYFSEGSRRDGTWNGVYEALEQRSWGRLLALDRATGNVRVLIPELYFGNGVTLTPDGSAVLVADQYRYRIVRYWLQGPHQRTYDFFAENLPGFVHNLHYDEAGILWAAIYQERSPVLDRFHPYPQIKNQLAKLPPALLGARSGEVRSPDDRGAGLIVALNAEGKVLRRLENPPVALNTLSTALPYKGALYIGTIEPGSSTVLRYPLPNLAVNE